MCGWRSFFPWLSLSVYGRSVKNAHERIRAASSSPYSHLVDSLWKRCTTSLARSRSIAGLVSTVIARTSRLSHGGNDAPGRPAAVRPGKGASISVSPAPRYRTWHPAAGVPTWTVCPTPPESGTGRRNREERNDATADGRGIQEQPARRTDGLLPREAGGRRHHAPRDRPRRRPRRHRLSHGSRCLRPAPGRGRRTQRPLLALLRDPPHAGGSAAAERASSSGRRRSGGTLVGADQGDRHGRAVRPAADCRPRRPQEQDQLP